MNTLYFDLCNWFDAVKIISFLPIIVDTELIFTKVALRWKFMVPWDTVQAILILIIIINLYFTYSISLFQNNLFCKHINPKLCASLYFVFL